ncbi:MAG: NAD-glutamate dehydrogenase, partial [Xanthomonadaceae bacterium]|nr:NAD-glutamate dehydrogenase [Xanthomonadaceae bacterium]
MNAIRAAHEVPFQSAVFEALKQTGFPVQRLDEAQFFIGAFFARISAGDFGLHTPEQWAAVVAGLLEFAQQRTAGRAAVRVLTPEAGYAMLQIVTDDMPFLVDTVSMVVSAHAQIHGVVHPVLPMRRDADGKLLALGDGQGTAESVMHFEVDRLVDADECSRLIAQVEASLDDVRAAVGDWAA